MPTQCSGRVSRRPRIGMVVRGSGQFSAKGSHSGTSFGPSSELITHSGMGRPLASTARAARTAQTRGILKGAVRLAERAAMAGPMVKPRTALTVK